MTSIRKKLVLLVLLAVLPALALLLFTGFEQRQVSIEKAKREVSLLAHAMAESQNDIANVTRQTLSTIALLPQIQSLDLQASRLIFKDVIDKHQNYHNLSLVALDGNVLTSSQDFTRMYLGDRRHFRQALEKKEFAAGEYIVTRMGPSIQAFPFAYPVLDKQGKPIAVLTTVIDLTSFSKFYQPERFPERFFLSATDRNGLRLFFYPPKKDTNPIGRPIKEDSWDLASQSKGTGIFVGRGSDGVSRIFAFEAVYLNAEPEPYMYVWAGLPEAYILGPANEVLYRNLLIMFFAAVVSLFFSWMIGKNTFLVPINNLVAITKEFARGNFAARSEFPAGRNEFWLLIQAFHDMADRLRGSQEALALSEKKSRLILNSAAEAIYGLDRSGCCTFCNPSCLKLLGYHSEEDLLGRNMHELIHHSFKDGTPRPIEKCTIYKAFESGETIHADGEVLWKADGTSFPAEYWSHSIYEHGEIIGAVVTFIDISERKQLEVERESLIDGLQDKTAEQERFVYTISHDLKSPLVTISGFLGLIEEDFTAGNQDAFKSDLQVVANATKRMKQLLEELLELSRLGNRKPQVERVPLGLLISKALENVSGQINSAGAVVEVASELPEVLVDEQGFLQVFENLIGNAAKFLNSNAGEPVIRIGVQRKDTELICFVSDNGIGIDPRYTNQVFNLFEKLDPDSGGTGVGLAIVKRVIETHGGRVWVESPGLGLGSTFFFSLPEAR